MDATLTAKVFGAGVGPGVGRGGGRAARGPHVKARAVALAERAGRAVIVSGVDTTDTRGVGPEWGVAVGERMRGHEEMGLTRWQWGMGWLRGDRLRERR